MSIWQNSQSISSIGSRNPEQDLLQVTQARPKTKPLLFPRRIRYSSLMNSYSPHLNLFVLIALLLSASTVPAQWAGFLGTDGSAASDDSNVPLEWGAEKNIAWSAPLPGRGNSSPIITAGKVILTAYTGYGLDRENPGDINDLKRHVLCFDARSGKELWRKDFDARQPEDIFKGYLQEHGYASNTPVSDGEQIFVFFGKSGVFALDMDGKQNWQADVGMESNNKKWGSASSPILYKNLVIVNASDESQALIAFDKQSGREVWRSEAEPMTVVYTMPRLLKIDDRTDLVLRVSGEIWGLNPANGKLRWYAEHGLVGTTTPSVLHDKGMLYTFGGWPKVGTVALKLGGTGNISKQIAWRTELTAGTPTPILYNDRLHWVDGKGFAIAMSTRDGEKVYKERLGASGIKIYASPVRIGKNLIQATRNKGTFVYRLGDRFEPVAHNTIAGDDSEFSATPAIANDSLYLRSWKALYCIRKPQG